ncbi:dihydrodipicolinate synthase family protein [Actinobaculum suis]|uniref:dihydrodipicolinate synthase family protein n=1 Tax=Actinobaculum suis TaxID=1657 RepID=UPI00066FE36A|nr:dihydrodipicolinate synthase family protein [Actinobaculum suis]
MTSACASATTAKNPAAAPALPQRTVPAPKYLCPVITPFREDGSIDADACRTHWNKLCASGLDGILLLGSMGEFFALDEARKQELIRLAGAELTGKTHLMVGTGANSVAQSVELSRYAFDHGADSVILIAPYYMRLSEEDLFAHFSQIAQALADKPVYLYNFPDRTGNPLTGPLIRKLVEKHPNIVGIKDTISDVAGTRQLIAEVSPLAPEFIFYSGMDENFFHNVLAGGNGCIAGLSNVFPEVCAAGVAAIQENDLSRIRSVQRILDAASALYGVVTFFPAAIKEATRQRGLDISPRSAATSAPLTEGARTQIRGILAQVEALMEAEGIVTT